MKKQTYKFLRKNLVAGFTFNKPEEINTEEYLTYYKPKIYTIIGWLQNNDKYFLNECFQLIDYFNCSSEKIGINKVSNFALVRVLWFATIIKQGVA